MVGLNGTWCLIREKDEGCRAMAILGVCRFIEFGIQIFRSWAQDDLDFVASVLNLKYNISLYCLCLLPCPMPKFCRLLFPLYLLFEPPQTPHHTMIARRSQIFVLPVIHCHGVYIAQP
jgi:hypothetical protein